MQTACGTAMWLASYPGKMVMSAAGANSTDATVGSSLFQLPPSTFNKLPNVILACQETPDIQVLTKLSAAQLVPVADLCCGSPPPPKTKVSA